MSTEVILEIDAGNTEFKWRIVSADGVLSSGRAAQSKVEEVFAPVLIKKQGVNRVRAVSVAGKKFDSLMNASLKACGLRSIEFARVEHEVAGVQCGYKDLSQLGVDRWMAIIAASISCTAPVMVVDLGSAVTIDFINDQKEHCGGYILPGWGLMQKSLLQGTKINASRIPGSYETKLVEPGLNTEDAIGMGRLKALTSVIESSLEDFRAIVNGDVTLVCTGGDAPGVIRHINSEAVYVADLVLDGLSIALD